MKRHGCLQLVLVGLVVAALLVGCGSTSGSGQQKGSSPTESKYPNKSVTIICHGTPGAGSDIFARQVAKALEKELGQPVVVENKPGGSGALAVSYVAKSPADGYTLLGVTNTMLTTPFVAETPNTLADLDAVARLVIDPCVIFVREESPYKTAQEMFEAAKKQTLKWGCPAVSSPDYIAVVGLREKYGLKIDPIPFPGGSESVAAVLKGDVVAGTGEPGEIAGQLKAGKIRILATFTGTRLQAYPDVPTVKELGYDAVVEKFRGIMAPKGVPADAKQVLADALRKVAEQDTSFRTYCQDNAMQLGYLGSDEFAQALEDMREQYSEYFQSHPTK